MKHRTLAEMRNLETETKRVEAYLSIRKCGLTKHEAEDKLEVNDLNSAIRNLKKQGVKIVDEWDATSGIRMKRYRIAA
ncbi:MAG: hypothetical protein BV459_06025 [Thermoplasmata archaeon M11B2D]|nr:MAG: hypothetical protein BV459_06025 [Thermoplasmata archaeon M11B2D]